MAIDLSETVLPLAEAARRLPRLRAGRPVSPATLWRWKSRGVRGVKLETLTVGGTCCTSLEALQRFCAALNGRAAQAPAPQLADPAVEQQLDAIGI